MNNARALIEKMKLLDLEHPILAIQRIVPNRNTFILYNTGAHPENKFGGQNLSLWEAGAMLLISLRLTLSGIYQVITLSLVQINRI